MKKKKENQERDLKKEIEEEERIIGELEAKIPFYEGDPKDLKAELSAHKDKKEEMVAYYNSGVEAAKGYKEKSIRAIVEKIKTGEQPAISGYHSTKGDIKIAFFDSPINKKAHIAFSEKALKNMQENPDNNIAVIDNKENV